MLVLLHILYIYTEYLWSCFVNRNRLLDEPRDDTNSSEDYERNIEFGSIRGVNKFISLSQETGVPERELNNTSCSDNLETDADKRLKRFTFNDDFVEFEEALYDFETRKISFFPPVYVQRYVTVVNVLKDERWKNDIKKVIDIGCAELGFFKFLKDIEGLENILEIDIDKKLLEEYSYRIQPWVSDYMKDRSAPLEVTVLCGNVTHPDHHLEGVDAVIAIELIEHLFPPDLEALPFNVFGVIQPRVAIFTTPNEEFNVLFDNFTGFRHDDHKFEWTRQEFESWAENICSRFSNYEVNFLGIGPGPKGNNHLGCCSQGAVFIRKDFLPLENFLSEPLKNFEEYEVIDRVEYPYRIDDRSEDKITLDDAENFMRVAIRIGDYFKEGRVEIPLATILMRVCKTCKSCNKLKEILEESDYKIEKDKDGDFIVIVPPSLVYPEDENDMDSEPEVENVKYIEHESGVNELVSDEWDSIEQDGASWITDNSDDNKNCNSYDIAADDVGVVKEVGSITILEDPVLEKSVSMINNAINDETFELARISVDKKISENDEHVDKVKRNKLDCNSVVKSVSFVSNSDDSLSVNSDQNDSSSSNETQLTYSLERSVKFSSPDDCVNNIRVTSSKYFIDHSKLSSEESDDEVNSSLLNNCNSQNISSVRDESSDCASVLVSVKGSDLTAGMSKYKYLDPPSVSYLPSMTNLCYISEPNVINKSDKSLSRIGELDVKNIKDSEKSHKRLDSFSSGTIDDNLKSLKNSSKDSVSKCIDKNVKSVGSSCNETVVYDSDENLLSVEQYLNDSVVNDFDENLKSSESPLNEVVVKDENLKLLECSSNKTLVKKVVSNSCQLPCTVSKINIKESKISKYKPSVASSENKFDNENVLTVDSAYEIDECIESVQEIIKKFDIDCFSKKKSKDDICKQLSVVNIDVANKEDSCDVLKTPNEVSSVIDRGNVCDNKTHTPGEGFETSNTTSIVSFYKCNNGNSENDVFLGNPDSSGCKLATKSINEESIKLSFVTKEGESIIESKNNYDNLENRDKKNVVFNIRNSLLKLNASDTTTNTSCSSGIETALCSENTSSTCHRFDLDKKSPSVEFSSGHESMRSCTCSDPRNNIDSNGSTLESDVHDFSCKAYYCMTCSSLSFSSKNKSSNHDIDDSQNVLGSVTEEFNKNLEKCSSDDKKPMFNSDTFVFRGQNVERIIKTYHYEADKPGCEKSDCVSDNKSNYFDNSTNSYQGSCSVENTFKLSDKMSRSHSLGHFVQHQLSSDETNKLVKSSDNSMMQDVLSWSNNPFELQKKLSSERCDERKPANENIPHQDDYDDEGESINDYLHGGMERQDSFSPDKAGDSGYPNSNSGRDMEMDLTPEQVKEIMTEGESSLENSPMYSPVEEVAAAIIPHLPIVHLGDHVENGDVANNNRDGEGNNMIGQAAVVGEPLEFHAVIDHPREMPLMAVAEIDEKIDEDEKNRNHGGNDCDLKNDCEKSKCDSNIDKKEIQSFHVSDIPCSHSYIVDCDKMSITRSKTFLDNPLSSKTIDISRICLNNSDSAANNSYFSNFTLKVTGSGTVTSSFTMNEISEKNTGVNYPESDCQNKIKEKECDSGKNCEEIHSESGSEQKENSNVSVCDVPSRSYPITGSEESVNKSSSTVDKPLTSKLTADSKLSSNNSETIICGSLACNSLSKLPDEETVIRSISYSGDTPSGTNLKSWESFRLLESYDCQELKRYANWLAKKTPADCYTNTDTSLSSLVVDSSKATAKSDSIPSCSNFSDPTSVVSNPDWSKLLESSHLLPPPSSVLSCDSEVPTNLVESVLNASISPELLIERNRIETRSLASYRPMSEMMTSFRHTQSEEVSSSSSSSENNLAFRTRSSENITSLDMPTSLLDEALDSIIQDIVDELLAPDLQPFADWLLQIQLELIVADGVERELAQNPNDGITGVINELENNFVVTESDPELTVEADVKGGGDSSSEQ